MEREYFARILAPQLEGAAHAAQATVTLKDGRCFSILGVLAAFESCAVLLVQGSGAASFQVTVSYDQMATVEVLGAAVLRDDLAQSLDGAAQLWDCATWSEFKELAESAYLRRKLTEYDWNVAATAQGIDMPRSNLYKKIEKHSLRRGP